MKNNRITTLCVFSLLFLSVGCGLKVGNVDVGRLATASADIVTGGKLSLKEQESIGWQMTAIIIGSSQLHQDAKLQNYVNQVGQWVASHTVIDSKNTQADWQFIVIDSPDFSAFSMPGGYVVISSGIVDRLSSEAELAAVLAHEIVHIEQKHQVTAIEKSKQFSGIGDLAFIAHDYQQTQAGGYDEDSAAKRAIAGSLFSLTHDLYTKGLGREDELDADQKAVVLMTRAGYDPYAYLAVMQLIQSMDDDHKTLLLATHPKPEDRIEVTSSSIEYVDKYASSTKVVADRFLETIR